jgi:hypothetical protein
MNEEATEQPKLMARRGGISAMGRGGTVTARGRGTGATASFSQRLKQTARRGGISRNPGRMASFVPPKEDFDTDEDQSDNGFDAMDIDSY